MLSLTTAILLAASPVAPAASNDLRTPAPDSHRAVLSAVAATRDAVSSLYHWATHSVSLDRYLAQQQALDVGRGVQSATERFTAMTADLSSDQRSRVLAEVTTIRDALAKAESLAGKLRVEAGAASADPVEVRFLAMELYGTLAGVQEIQQAIGNKLDLPGEAPAENRAR
jgi:hypothetical protein